MHGLWKKGRLENMILCMKNLCRNTPQPISFVIIQITRATTMLVYIVQNHGSSYLMEAREDLALSGLSDTMEAELPVLGRIK